MKRIITFMLACVMMVSTLAESTYAIPIMPMQAEEIEFSAPKTGGLRPMEFYEMDVEDFTEVFEEDTDKKGKGSALYTSEWDKYSTNYYYNQLLNEQQAFWDKLDALCLSYLIGSESISSSRNSKGEIIYPTKMVSFNGMSLKEAFDIALMFKYSNPQYYFLDLGVYGKELGSGGTIAFSVFPTFTNGNDRALATARMKSVIDSFLVQINAQPDELSKEKKAHDLICEKVGYDEGYENPTIPMNVYNQVAYSVFCTDTTVCAGYSQAMQLLMNAVGIDCAIVTSTDHEWNLIRINDTWYYLDLTWNDLKEEQQKKYGISVGYMFFNRSYPAPLGKELQKEWEQGHKTESIWNGYLPALVYDSGATWYDMGKVHTPVATLTAPQITASGSVVTLSAPVGEMIYYTTDGTDPSIASTRADKYNGPFMVNAVTNVKAISVANGCYDSGISGTTVIPQCRVTFEGNGGYMNSKGVKSIAKVLVCGNQIGELVSPKRKNYAFLGWYTAKSGGSKVSSSTVVTNDWICYARWAKIKGKKATISSAKSSSAGKMKIKIKKIKSANGYQIRYSLKQNMASAKTKITSENTCTINKLKKGKTYYVQVRMYQKESVSGKNKYGKWSKSRTVKVKK